MSKRIYKTRYSVEEWNKPVPPDKKRKQVHPNVLVNSTDYGYCDKIFIASIVIEDGEPSVLLLGDEGHPTKEIFELVRDAINHQLENHT